MAQHWSNTIAKKIKYATITYVQITIMFLVPHLKLIVFSSGALIMDLTSKMLPTSENFCQLPGGAASWPHQALGHRWRVSHFQGKHHTCIIYMILMLYIIYMLYTIYMLCGNAFKIKSLHWTLLSYIRYPPNIKHFKNQQIKNYCHRYTKKGIHWDEF